MNSLWAKQLNATGESGPISLSGLYRKALAAWQRAKADLVKGWELAGAPNRELSQAELTTPLALELERAVEAALLTAGIRGYPNRD